MPQRQNLKEIKTILDLHYKTRKVNLVSIEIDRAHRLKEIRPEKVKITILAEITAYRILIQPPLRVISRCRIERQVSV